MTWNVTNLEGQYISKSIILVVVAIAKIDVQRKHGATKAINE